MEEIWKNIDSDGFYEVSSMGNVRSWKNGRYGKRDSPRLLTPALRYENNYLIVTLWIDKKMKSHLVHRLVANAFIPNPQNKPQTNHKNGIKTDNRVSNLEWVTARENMKHMVKNGWHNTACGEESGISKLTNDDVIKIRKMYKSGEYTQYQLSDIFDVRQDNISRIVNRKTWKHL